MSDLYPDLPFSGSYTALVTPFTSSGALDEAAFEKLVDWQIEQGTQAHEATSRNTHAHCPLSLAMPSLLGINPSLLEKRLH